MERRDSPEVESARVSEDTPPTPKRRLAGLIGPPAARRVALSKLVVAGVLVSSLVILGLYGGVRIFRSAALWVDLRPEHRIKFSMVEISPAPDPWVVGGTARLLEEVRPKAKFGDEISLLDLDLKELEKDFRRCSLVKDVLRIDRSRYGRLAVELAYRKPVAVVKHPGLTPGVFVVDDDAVVFDDRDIDWTSSVSPYRVKGMDTPLLKIWGLAEASPTPRFGVPWKRKVGADVADDADPVVLGAARIARFFLERGHPQDDPPGLPDFASIWVPQNPDDPYFLIDSGGNLVNWGRAPGMEKAGFPSPEARWDMLKQWVRAHGRLEAQRPDYLFFTPSGASLGRGKKSAGTR